MPYKIKPKIGWTVRGEYFEGTIEEKRAQEQALPLGYISPYLTGASRAIAQRKRSEKIRQQQKEEQQLERLLHMRATGAGGGSPGQPGYIAPTYVTIKQKFANLEELRKWRLLKRSYGGVGGYVAPGQYVPSAANLSFMGGTGLTTSLRMGGDTQAPISSILKEHMPDVRITPQPSPQKIMPTAQPTPTPTAPTPTMAQPTPIAPTPQPTQMPQISFAPTTPQAQPTYQPAPTTAYQSTYYQANGYKPYGGYQQDTFGDKPFGYAYKQPRLQQSYTGI